MKILFTFPGQGPQVPQMLHNLPDNSLTHSLIEQASLALGEDVLLLDNADAFHSTGAVQLCLLIAGVVWAKQCKAEGIEADFCSGLSIGAFPAAVVAGALDFSDAVKLVALRGELMQQAYPQGFGLSAITGLRQAQIEALVAQVNSDELPVYLANINAEDQLVIAGSDAAMKQVMLLAKEQGAQKTHRLAVSVPSHCALLDEPAARLVEAFKQVKISRPVCGYLSGTTGRVYWQPEKIADDLAMNMARTVNWRDAMVAAYQRDVRLALEMPPGCVLTGLTKRAMDQGEALSVCQSGMHVAGRLATRLRENER
ncbi:malonate decarboxylase subunit epsilon [Rahnella sp. AA]|uniref:malonate decarboxylase subunit epsilon n=1 Tax=Rahnella sp. AA TaxID=2057180 RepID=UPI000C34AD0C|nr:malonate decarboxylase subunit epsilon [Rahnella sp. AA]PKE29790.1 malonate decarboxylase subunit epsilon [Rahnella sp. AA]